MNNADYHFVSHWRVPGTCEEVYQLLQEAEELPRWWPSVYLEARTRTPAGPHGLGGVVDFHTKGWLPYTLRWRSSITATDFPRGFTLTATGDFVGTGVWQFRQDGPEAAIRFDWCIRADKPLLRTWSFLLRPVFAANHRWAMRQGELSLALELRRQRARSAAERASIDRPPGPTFRPFPQRRERGVPEPRPGPSARRAARIALVAAGLLYAGWPRQVDLRQFEAKSMASRETALWRHYYERRHLKLAWALYAMNRAEYGFSPADSVRLAAYAAIAAAVFQPTRSRSEAQAAIPWLYRYFDLLGRRARLDVPPQDLANAELNWWQLRREHATPESYGDVIARVQSGIYGVPESALTEAARERAQAMDVRDRLSGAGLESTDWDRIETMLHRAYANLKAAISPAP